jgi:hypothetical protein
MNTQPGCLTLKITPEVGKAEHLSLTKQICTTFISQLRRVCSPIACKNRQLICMNDCSIFKSSFNSIFLIYFSHVHMCCISSLHNSLLLEILSLIRRENAVLISDY